MRNHKKHLIVLLAAALVFGLLTGGLANADEGAISEEVSTEAMLETTFRIGFGGTEAFWDAWGGDNGHFEMAHFQLHYWVWAGSSDMYIPTGLVNGKPTRADGMQYAVVVNRQAVSGGPGINAWIDATAEITPDGAFYIVRAEKWEWFTLNVFVEGSWAWAGRTKVRIRRVFWFDGPDANNRHVYKPIRFASPSVVMGFERPRSLPPPPPPAR